ncbi:hypothetical protein ALC62_06680 [Cyphomyrmex costatus]|uniref:Uncharacterized protein n=1 Tax=Cyphomyrmex costatus TaxID=456900 RepID=A0A151IIJ4_9HYME|nr:hypothetical protein ALC62_06680 [Cyphomyrmex costatus]
MINCLTLTASCKSIEGYFLKNVTIGIPKASVELFNSNLILSAEAMITRGSFLIYLKNKFIQKALMIVCVRIYTSEGLIRKITGTLVHGRIANSVTTAVTRSAGVTSYIAQFISSRHRPHVDTIAIVLAFLMQYVPHDVYELP